MYIYIEFISQIMKIINRRISRRNKRMLRIPLVYYILYKLISYINDIIIICM